MSKKTQNVKPIETEAKDKEAAVAEEKQPTGDVTLTGEEFAKVKSHIEQLLSDNEALTDTAKRVQAEFDNYRRRNASLHKDSVDEGVRTVITQLLPVLDNYERALSSLDAADASVSEGVRLIYKQLLSTLEKLGLSEIEAAGKFDPNFHDAVMQEPSETAESGDILEVLQKGYMVNERIIRHSMVKVAE